MDAACALPLTLLIFETEKEMMHTIDEVFEWTIQAQCWWLLYIQQRSYQWFCRQNDLSETWMLCIVRRKETAECISFGVEGGSFRLAANR